MEKMDITTVGKLVVVLVVTEEEEDLTEEVSKIQIGEIHLIMQEKQICQVHLVTFVETDVVKMKFFCY